MPLILFPILCSLFLWQECLLQFGKLVLFFFFSFTWEDQRSVKHSQYWVAFVGKQWHVQSGCTVICLYLQRTPAWSTLSDDCVEELSSINHTVLAKGGCWVLISYRALNLQSCHCNILHHGKRVIHFFVFKTKNSNKQFGFFDFSRSTKMKENLLKIHKRV